MSKIIDCVTFFQENLQMEIRFSVLKDVVDKFVVCESIYDHRGNQKKINFSKESFPEIKHKIEHIVLDKKFPSKNTPWQNQALQREFIFNGIEKDNENDYIMFSDPDEIPNPQILKNLNLKMKYGIFLQNMYCYKFNLFNKYESPWEGTRVCKKKNLKSIDYMRQKVLKKNLNKAFWKFYKEKNIEIIENGGWHFNSIISPAEISKKLRTFAHTEFSKNQYSDINIIKKNIEEHKDLFGRNITYTKVNMDNSFPEYILKNKNNLKEWIL